MRILLMFFLLMFNVQLSFSQEFKINNDVEYQYKDTYDSDSILYKRIWTKNGNIDSSQYFDKKGNIIKNIILLDKLIINGEIDAKIIGKIRQAILNEFDWKNVTIDGQGIVLLSFLVKPDKEISEVRVIYGINESINNEIIRAAKRIDKKLLKTINCQNNSILVIIPIRSVSIFQAKRSE